MKKLRLGQRGLEDADRQVEVLILFHVKVDKLRPFVALLIHIKIVYGGLIELRHTAHEFGERLLIVQGMGLSIDTRDLHGDIIDVRLLERLEGVLVTAVCLLVSQHDLTEEVHVLTDVLMVALGEVLRQRRARRIKDDIKAVLA